MDSRGSSPEGRPIIAQGEDAKRATNICIALRVKGETLGSVPRT